MGFTVITTIQAPNSSVSMMVNRGLQNGQRSIIVGDRKTPDTTWPEGVEFIGLAQQERFGYSLAPLLPLDHYARKNLGYLAAILSDADCIFDTDDDNAPLPGWKPRTLQTSARRCSQSGWVNAYRWFSDEHIWPRGLPLDGAHRDAATPSLSGPALVLAPLQQGLANGSPDVDAVWRLLMDREVTFRSAESVSLSAGCWCPFNSQSTWWFPPAFPLMYLPSFVSFRMTDIWRSFSAQRCLWALGHEVVFHGPEMFQDRNPHNLLRDFEQEVPGYLGNARFREVLDRLDLPVGRRETGNNLRRCYEALVSADLIPSKELPLVECWLADIGACE